MLRDLCLCGFLCDKLLDTSRCRARGTVHRKEQPPQYAYPRMFSTPVHVLRGTGTYGLFSPVAFAINRIGVSKNASAVFRRT